MSETEESEGFVFFITRIGEADSPERKRADAILKHVVRPAAKNHHLEALRADEDATPGQVTPQIIKTLLDATVVVADLTGRNPNVYYELAIAHSFQKPVVIMVDHPSNLAFDTKDERAIPIGDDGTKLGADEAEATRDALDRSLAKVLADGYVVRNLLTEGANARNVDELAESGDNPLAEEVSRLSGLVEALIRSSPTRFGDLSFTRAATRWLKANPPEVELRLAALSDMEYQNEVFRAMRPLPFIVGVTFVTPRHALLQIERPMTDVEEQLFFAAIEGLRLTFTLDIPKPWMKSPEPQFIRDEDD